jgi:hypothetical protein
MMRGGVEDAQRHAVDVTHPLIAAVSNITPNHLDRHSLRVALARPRDRGGGRLAQHYTARTPALVAGVTPHR